MKHLRRRTRCCESVVEVDQASQQASPELVQLFKKQSHRQSGKQLQPSSVCVVRCGATDRLCVALEERTEGQVTEVRTGPVGTAFIDYVQISSAY